MFNRINFNNKIISKVFPFIMLMISGLIQLQVLNEINQLNTCICQIPTPQQLLMLS